MLVRILFDWPRERCGPENCKIRRVVMNESHLILITVMSVSKVQRYTCGKINIKDFNWKDVTHVRML